MKVLLDVCSPVQVRHALPGHEVHTAVQGLKDDPRSDAEIKADLEQRLRDLISEEDAGLTFEEVFNRPA